MKEDILYLVDNTIQFYSYKQKKTIVKVIPKKIIYRGKIGDPKKFYIYLKELLEENKIMSYFFMSNIKIIIDDFYTKVDKYMFNEILNKLGFKNINFINQKTLIKIKSNSFYLNCNNEYMIIYYKDEYKKIKTLFLDSNVLAQSKIVCYLQSIYKNYDIIMFGNATFMSEKINYVYQNSKTYFLDTICNL